jgi:ribonuclease R
VIPDDPKMRVDFYVPLHELNGAKDGDKVIVKMTEWQERAHNPMGSVIMVLGRPGDMDVEMNSILAEFDFPLSFPKNVEEEAARIPDEITKEEIAKRRDMRSVTTLTIDPDDAKDFDDAISIQENGKWELGSRDSHCGRFALRAHRHRVGQGGDKPRHIGLSGGQNHPDAAREAVEHGVLAAAE